MSYNKNDEYNKLIQLLYPSIESSGNVYYGQTRKLTTDAVLDRSKVDSISTVYNKLINGRNVKFFKWQIGPLHDELPLGEYSNNFDRATFPGSQRLFVQTSDTYAEISNLSYSIHHGTAFAKYHISMIENEESNITASGDFTTFSYTPKLSLLGIYITNNVNPINSSQLSNDTQFVFDSVNNDLYINILNGTIVCTYDDICRLIELETPLTLYAYHGSAHVELNLLPPYEGLENYVYEYKYTDSDTWVTFPTDPSNHVMTNGRVFLHNNQGVSLRRKCHEEYGADYDGYLHNIQISLSGNTVTAYGNVFSMLPIGSKFSIHQPPSFADEDTHYNNLAHLFEGCSLLDRVPQIDSVSGRLPSQAYYCIFKDCLGITTASHLDINASMLPINGCAYMFYNCSNLSVPPSISVDQFAPNSCESMFENCVKLEHAPHISAKLLRDNCFKQMFKDCTNLQDIHYDILGNTVGSGCFSDWLSGTSGGSAFITGQMFSLQIETRIDTSTVICLKEPSNYTIDLPNEPGNIWYNENMIPLTIVAHEPTSISLYRRYDGDTVYYAKNRSLTNVGDFQDIVLTEYTSDSTIDLDSNESIMFVRPTDYYYTGTDTVSHFNFNQSLPGEFSTHGNIMSIVKNAGSFNTSDGFVNNIPYLFYSTFRDTQVVRAPVIPLTAIGDHVCADMFRQCYHLMYCPDITASQIDDSGCASMFLLCKLQNIPFTNNKITLTSDSSLSGCFSQCASLATANLNVYAPNTSNALYGTFFGCSNLKHLHLTINGTTLADALDSVAERCTSLDSMILNVDDSSIVHNSIYTYSTNIYVNERTYIQIERGFEYSNVHNCYSSTYVLNTDHKLSIPYATCTSGQTFDIPVGSIIYASINNVTEDSTVLIGTTLTAGVDFEYLSPLQLTESGTLSAASTHGTRCTYGTYVSLVEFAKYMNSANIAILMRIK